MSSEAAGNPLGHTCPQCSSTRLGAQPVKTALWHGERLVLIEEVPALVCLSCGERFYDDRTAMALDLMQGGGFPPSEAVGRAIVPIFTFAPPKPAGGATRTSEGV